MGAEDSAEAEVCEAAVSEATRCDGGCGKGLPVSFSELPKSWAQLYHKGKRWDLCPGCLERVREALGIDPVRVRGDAGP